MAGESARGPPTFTDHPVAMHPTRVPSAAQLPSLVDVKTLRPSSVLHRPLARLPAATSPHQVAEQPRSLVCVASCTEGAVSSALPLGRPSIGMRTAVTAAACVPGTAGQCVSKGYEVATRDK